MFTTLKSYASLAVMAALLAGAGVILAFVECWQATPRPDAAPLPLKPDEYRGPTVEQYLKRLNLDPQENVERYD